MSRYLQNYVDNIFSGAWETRSTTPLPADIPMPSLEQGTKIEQLYDLLNLWMVTTLSHSSLGHIVLMRDSQFSSVPSIQININHAMGQKLRNTCNSRDNAAKASDTSFFWRKGQLAFYIIETEFFLFTFTFDLNSGVCCRHTVQS